MISVGELNTNKNNSVIISAIEKLKNKNVYYILCGVGEKESELKEQADKAGLFENIRFLGYRNDVKELYEASDCFVMPSFREGLSRSIMEAMASGLPCVASRIRGNTDLLEETQCGYLCSNVEEYSEAICSLAFSTECRQDMKEESLTRIKQFGKDIIVKKLTEIYKMEYIK